MDAGSNWLLHLFLWEMRAVVMLHGLIILSSIYVLYVFGMKQSIRYNIFGNVMYDIFSYMSSLAIGCIASVSAFLYLLLPLTLHHPIWQLAILPTLVSIGLGELLYARNQKLSQKLVSYRIRSIERSSKSKHYRIDNKSK